MTARVLLSVVVGLIVFSCIPALSEDREIPEEQRSAAENMAETVNARLGDSGSINKNAIVPLTSDTKMSTFDGQKAFDVNLLCQGANTFADVMIAPLANGNVQIRSIRQDTNMDGSIDSFQTPNWEASAICANGYLLCGDANETGTCTSYQWAARDADYLVGRKQTAMTNMGGCYCINNQCGSNLSTTNMETITRDLATGLAAALAEKHKFFTLTNVKVDGFYAELQGSDGASCNPASADSVLGTEEVAEIENSDYVNNPAGLNGAGFQAQKNSPLYQQLSASANDVGFESRSCRIQRITREDKVSTSDIVSFDSGAGGIYEIDSDTLRIVLGRIGDNYWDGNCVYKTLSTNVFVHRPDRIISATFTRAVFDDWLQIHTVANDSYEHVWNGPRGTWSNPTSGVPDSCELSTSWDQTFNADFRGALRNVGQVEFRVRVAVAGSGEGYVFGEIDLDPSCKVLPDQIDDQCGYYQNNEKCSLLEETVDGVKTFTNGHPTGLIPLPTSAGALCGQNQQRDWMVKERLYRCESDYAYDFDNAFERMEYVKENSDLEKWRDRTSDGSSGAIEFSNGEFGTYSGLGAQVCTMTCKTRKPKTMNDMTLSGPTGENHIDPMTYDFFYHECTGEGSAVCPAGDGEEVLKACQCLNEFAEATLMVQSLRLAGQDMICTNGEKAMPDGEAKSD